MSYEGGLFEGHSWIPCKNGGTTEIPPFGICKINDATIDPTTGEYYLELIRPDANSISPKQLAVNGPTAIKADPKSHGGCHQDAVGAALCEDITWSAADTFGTETDKYTLKKNNTGFLAHHASGSATTVDDGKLGVLSRACPDSTAIKAIEYFFTTDSVGTSEATAQFRSPNVPRGSSEADIQTTLDTTNDDIEFDTGGLFKVEVIVHVDANFQDPLNINWYYEAWFKGQVDVGAGFSDIPDSTMSLTWSPGRTESSTSGQHWIIMGQTTFLYQFLATYKLRFRHQLVSNLGITTSGIWDSNCKVILTRLTTI